MRLVVLVLVLVACGGFVACGSKPPPDPAYTPAGPKPCEKMADHVIGLMTPTDPATGKPVEREPQTADALTRLLIERCTKDAWTVDAQQCFLKLSAFADIDKQCTPLLTVAQRDGLVQAIDELFGKEPPAAP